MKIQRIGERQVTLQISEAEFFVIKSCIREAFATIDGKAFPMRIGASSDVVYELATELRNQAEAIGLVD